MKKIMLAIAAVSVAIALSYGYFTYMPNMSRSAEVGILIDVTDSFVPQLTGNDISEFLEMKRNRWNSYTLRIQKVADTDYTQVKRFALEECPFIPLCSPIKRDTDVAAFMQNVDASIQAINVSATNLKHTSVFVPLIHEANRIAATRADKKILILNSDCRENGALISSYGDKGIELTHMSRNVVIDALKNIAKPDDLHGLDVFIVYQPTADNDDAFVLMSGYFKQILEQAGASVYIGANLIQN